MEDKSLSEVLGKTPAEIMKRSGESAVEPLKLKVYERRWLVLIIYMIYAGACSYQWIEYSIITNIVTRYHVCP